MILDSNFSVIQIFSKGLSLLRSGVLVVFFGPTVHLFLPEHIIESFICENYSGANHTHEELFVLVCTYSVILTGPKKP